MGVGEEDMKGEKERWLGPSSPESNYKLQNCERKEKERCLLKPKSCLEFY